MYILYLLLEKKKKKKKELKYSLVTSALKAKLWRKFALDALITVQKKGKNTSQCLNVLKESTSVLHWHKLYESFILSPI